MAAVSCHKKGKGGAQMTQHEAYNGIYDTHPDCDAHRVFFAFSLEQIVEGMERCGYKDKSEIRHAGSGIYGSPEALRSFLGEYERRANQVAAECDPQKVYDYEYANHECDYVLSDTEAIELVVDVFGKDRARLIKRRNAREEV
jgi:hypothetical protein